jgi:hypothetical protein
LLNKDFRDVVFREIDKLMYETDQFFNYNDNKNIDNNYFLNEKVYPSLLGVLSYCTPLNKDSRLSCQKQVLDTLTTIKSVVDKKTNTAEIEKIGELKEGLAELSKEFLESEMK